MTKTLTLKNIEIYTYANQLAEAFNDGGSNDTLPIKINFFLQKNIKTILELGQDIDKVRTEIIQKYGTLNEETQNYDIPAEKVPTAQAELTELFNLEQEVRLHMFDINSFDNVELSEKKGNAILFMIYDPEEEKEITEKE